MDEVFQRPWSKNEIPWKAIETREITLGFDLMKE